MDIDDIYQKAYEKHGATPKALHWISYASQAIRFKYLVADLELEDRSILDAGCGLGDALPFLYARADRFNYLGMDINHSFINEAKERYSGHKFKVGDPFSGKLKDRFDVVISSGVMNHNIEGWQQERRQMIARLFDLCKEALAFNMAGSFKPISNDSKIAYADANEILEYCLTLTSKVSLRTDYSSYDFTIVMYR
jgi:SAM-dependent methyltransferase